MLKIMSELFKTVKLLFLDFQVKLKMGTIAPRVSEETKATDTKYVSNQTGDTCYAP